MHIFCSSIFVVRLVRKYVVLCGTEEKLWPLPSFQLPTAAPLLTCSDWESSTKSLWTVWLVSTWERMLITWLRSSRHCWCKASCKPDRGHVKTPHGLIGWLHCFSWTQRFSFRGWLTFSLSSPLLLPCTWESATRRASSSVRQANSSWWNWSFWAWILSVSVFKLENCTVESK